MEIKLNDYDKLLLTNRAKKAGLTPEEYMVFCLNVNLGIPEDKLEKILKGFKKTYKL